MRQLEVYVNDMKAGMLTEQDTVKGCTFAYNVKNYIYYEKM